MLKKGGRHILIYGGTDFIFKFVNFAVFPVYANIFSVEEFGVMELALVSAGLVGIISNFGINNAVQRFYWDQEAGRKEQADIVSTGIYLLLICSTLVVGAVFAGLYPLKDVLQSNYGLPWIVVCLALVSVIPDQLIRYSLDTIRLHFSPWKFAFISFIRNLSSVVIGLFLIVMLGYGIDGFFWGILLAVVVALPFGIAFIKRDLRFEYRKDTAKRIFTYGYPFIFAGLAYWIFGSMDRWMLAQMADTTQVGLYSISFKFAGIVMFINSAFGQAWSPMAMKVRRDYCTYREIYSSILTLLFFVLVLIGMLIALFSKEILILITPMEYWLAAPIMGTVVMGAVLSGTTQVTAVGISIKRRTKLFATAAWITAIVNFTLNWILIPHYGAFGAGLATLISYGILTALYMYWSQKLHPIPLEKYKLGYLVSVVVMVVPVTLFINRITTMNEALLQKIVVIMAFLVGAYFVGILNTRHIRNITGTDKLRPSTH